MTPGWRDTLRRLRRRLAPCDTGNEHHNRGLTRFDGALASAGLPSLTDRLASVIATRGRASLLEIGCGEGRLLLDVLARFGDAVELHGINHPRWPVVTDARGLRATNARYAVLPRERLDRLRMPTVHLADAEDLSRFTAGPFDVIASQVVIAHVRDKARVLEESARLLAPAGTLLHEIDHLDEHARAFGGDDLPRFAIQDEHTPVSTTAHLRARGVAIDHGFGKGSPIVLAQWTHDGERGLDLGLVLDAGSCVNLKAVSRRDPHVPLWGMRSVYRLARRG